MTNSKSTLTVKNVSMHYRIATEKINSYKEYFIKRLKNDINYKDFRALHDVSFEVNKGEVFGIIGKNGAGKSTLLKIISGIIKPTKGNVERKGTIAPLIELGAGFKEELTGIENIYLNGLLLGYSKKFLKEKEEEIIRFSELEEFIYTPLKNYSSGMKARLGFSIATSIKPDILIVDEVLAVGDYTFREKCEKRVNEMIQSGTTVLFVSHSITQIEKLCNRVLWLERGIVKEHGQTDVVCSRYKNFY
ncbi:ABC transporter ATP-binding protein [Paenibacillus sp. J5C_2022]|uniref:ABC transporter ATP-binding protein n=1 Tax=Paenibacillus sp. J5C2022 TaxID=2977129 RepID=UPI0021D2AEF5|nr:ABC transporter ATP-binding protein [Paenibacillus sp. J5C2022]MCU6709195.1 ABC transporter ATP-binding protein [Paenibacillus sp. J5C2022]